MPDPLTERFDKSFGQKDPSGPTVQQDELLSRFDRAFGAAKKTVKIARKVAKAGAVDIVGKTARFFGAALSTPKAAAIHALAGTKTPVEFSPTADVDQFREVINQFKSEGFDPGVSPEVVSMATDIPAMMGLNAIGKNVVLPVARAVAEPARRLPGIKQAAEFVKTGSSLPKQYRAAAQGEIRLAEGEASLSAYKREKTLGAFLKLPTPTQDRIQTAIERRTEALLPEGERGIADALKSEYGAQVAARTAQGGRAHELGAHLTPEERAGNVAFTKRVLTPEARQELKGKRYGTAVAPFEQPGGLGTGRLARRVADPTLTSEELNLARQAEGKGRLFEPIVPATFAGGEANDVRVMNLRIVNQLAKKFGQPTKDQGESIIRHFGVGTGFDDATKAALSKTKLPPELDELVGNLNKRLQPEEFGKIAQANRIVNQEFKKWALFSPGFVSRNVQNNVIQTMIFGNTNPMTWKRALQIRGAMTLGKGGDATVKVGSKTMKIGDYIEDAIRRGIIGGGQTAQDIPKSKFVPTRALRAGNQWAEDASRIAFDLYNQGKGMDPMKSADRVDQILFNYSSRTGSRLKKELRANAVPFINWSSQIGPLFVRTAMERPGSLGFLGNVAQRQNEAMGFGDEEKRAKLGPDVVQGGGIVVGKGEAPGSVRAALPQGYGSYSVNEYIPEGATPEAAADVLANQLYPTLSVPFGLAAGRDPFTHKPLEWDATAPSTLKFLFTTPQGKAFAESHGITVNKDGQVKAPGRLAYVLRSIPPMRLSNLLADWTLGPSKGRKQRAASFALGYREVERDPNWQPRRNPGQ